MKGKRIILSLLALILAAGCVTIGYFIGRRSDSDLDPDATEWEESDSVNISGTNDGNINIPCTDLINLKAGKIKQSVSFYNPSLNKCFFKITLSSASGNVLWESKLIPPGKGIRNINLKSKLNSGLYKNAVLTYECFDLSDKKALNGSKIILDLNVYN